MLRMSGYTVVATRRGGHVTVARHWANFTARMDGVERGGFKRRNILWLGSAEARTSGVGMS
ncbi:hypothetical protein L484_014195 [Morus notabilis]|uniref:Uncharacterized protein n=1 Tax=Morus notabilis TaxID=981085 RepID=W9RJX4_9ROSA|nr:hypothetical protein L484_014195 [Morus notabilis]